MILTPKSVLRAQELVQHVELDEGVRDVEELEHEIQDGHVVAVDEALQP